MQGGNRQSKSMDYDPSHFPGRQWRGWWKSLGSGKSRGTIHSPSGPHAHWASSIGSRSPRVGCVKT